jgi:uncharacterized protein
MPAAQPTVTVAGTGSASAVPDTAVLELGVETRGSTPAQTLESCRRAQEQILAALDAEGVEPARRASSGLTLHEDWESRQPGKGPITYQAGARLTVRLAEPARAGQVAAAAAREAAWRDALARAGQYAALAGVALGEVLEVKEAPPPPPDARPMRLLAEAVPGGPATEPGESIVWAAVTVTWALRASG